MNQPGSGNRVQWHDLPAQLRSEIEARAGGTVAAAASQPGGFSPGMAARLTLSNGERLFVKAVHPSANPDSPDIHRREAHIAAKLPITAPAPRFLWHVDQGPEGWVVLAFEDVEGRHPFEPWTKEDLERVMAAMNEMARALTPSPVETEGAASYFETELCGWKWLQEGPPAGLDEWSRRNLDALAELEAHAPEAVRGTTLLHLDTRADNILVTPDRIYFIDWPHARVGAAWVDVVGMAPSVAMQGGPEPEALLHMHEAGRAAPAEQVTAAIAALAGLFTERSHRPPSPGIPNLRSFQAAQAIVARKWLAQRTSLK